MLFTQLAALALVAIGLATPGCGKSSASRPLSKAEIVAKANVICERFFVQLHSHGTKSAAHLAANVELLASYEQIEASELRNLTPPSSMTADWKSLLEGHQMIADDSAQLVRYVKEGKLQAAHPLLAAGNQTQTQVLAIARRNGIKECARAT